MSEVSAAEEYLQLRRSSLWPDRGAPEGSGQRVLLVGGFGVPPLSMRPLRRWLTGGGWDVHVADLGWNTDCGTTAVDAVVSALCHMASDGGDPVTIVGHSRGGLLGRVAAVRAPDLVQRLVTVCTPWAIGPPERPGVATAQRIIGFGRRHGLDVLGSMQCASGACCQDFREQMSILPSSRWILVRSSVDRIAGELAQAAGADMEIVTTTTHLGGVLSVPGWGAIAQALR
jgi:pimeloyl-ACP methyl ester carboxylesterase